MEDCLLDNLVISRKIEREPITSDSDRPCELVDGRDEGRGTGGGSVLILA